MWKPTKQLCFKHISVCTFSRCVQCLFGCAYRCVPWDTQRTHKRHISPYQLLSAYRCVHETHRGHTRDTYPRINYWMLTDVFHETHRGHTKDTYPRMNYWVLTDVPHETHRGHTKDTYPRINYWVLTDVSHETHKGHTKDTYPRINYWMLIWSTIFFFMATRYKSILESRLLRGVCVCGVYWVSVVVWGMWLKNKNVVVAAPTNSFVQNLLLKLVLL